MKCLYREWFMTRKVEKDEFGCDIEFKVHKKKRCPTCRRIVMVGFLDYIGEMYKKHPEVND